MRPARSSGRRRRLVPGVVAGLLSTATIAGCGDRESDAIAVSIDELVAGVELAVVDDPDGVVEAATALVLDGGPEVGEIAVDRAPTDPRFDLVLSYRTGGCPAVPELTAEVDDDTIRFEVEIRFVDADDCPAAEYIEAIGIDLAESVESLAVIAELG